MIEVEVCFAKGERRKWKCLIDTGAHYSVVRPDVVPPGAWEVAREHEIFRQQVVTHFLVAKEES